MPSAPKPGPAAAYSLWTGACESAGSHGRPAAEDVPVREGLGRVTASAVRAHWPAPRAACAAMDGIAFRAPTTAADGVWQLRASEFSFVDTGDLMPDGMDTVVERERIKVGSDGTAVITGVAPRGLNVRATGEDFLAGELLIPAGHPLRPVDLAGAAAAGYTTLKVTRRPVAAIIPTGDEIRPTGSALGPGDIIDSNSVMLASRAREVGADVIACDVQPDDPDALAAELARVAPAADIVLIVAGSSGGRSDYTAAVLGRAGGLVVRGVAIRPGHPVLLGYAVHGRAREDHAHGAVPVIGVPGYPIAAAVIFELFAVPLITALQGRQPAARQWQRGQLACGWVSPLEVEDWVPVSMARAEPDGETLIITPGRRGAGSVSRLIRAQAWWPIPIGQSKFAQGDLIDILPVPGAPG